MCSLLLFCQDSQIPQFGVLSSSVWEETAVSRAQGTRRGRKTERKRKRERMGVVGVGRHILLASDAKI